MQYTDFGMGARFLCRLSLLPFMDVAIPLVD